MCLADMQWHMFHFDATRFSFFCLAQTLETNCFTLFLSLILKLDRDTNFFSLPGFGSLGLHSSPITSVEKKTRY